MKWHNLQKQPVELHEFEREIHNLDRKLAFSAKLMIALLFIVSAELAVLLARTWH